MLVLLQWHPVSFPLVGLDLYRYRVIVCVALTSAQTIRNEAPALRTLRCCAGRKKKKKRDSSGSPPRTSTNHPCKVNTDRKMALLLRCAEDQLRPYFIQYILAFIWQRYCAGRPQRSKPIWRGRGNRMGYSHLEQAVVQLKLFRSNPPSSPW